MTRIMLDESGQAWSFSKRTRKENKGTASCCYDDDYG